MSNSLYTKLMQARLKLQNSQLKKSGHNKFAGYDYFELSDFLPATQEIFAELGLCGIVSFSETQASLNIIDTESGEQFIITSPMAEANLKGSHPIQNLGAVQTYQRRYLWVTAMEIVEQDALDRGESNQPALKPYPPKDFEANKTAWVAAIKSGQRTTDELIKLISTKGTLSAQQMAQIHSWAPTEAAA